VRPHLTHRPIIRKRTWFICRYTAYWNLTYYIASIPPKPGAPPTSREKRPCGTGPYKSVSQNFTATFQVGLLATNTTKEPIQTSFVTQFPSPEGTLIPRSPERPEPVLSSQQMLVVLMVIVLVLLTVVRVCSTRPRLGLLESGIGRRYG
jgi:hypothetical protein